MIYQGEHGSLCIYYKGILISSFELSQDKPFEAYEAYGRVLLEDSLRDGIPLNYQIPVLKLFIDEIYKRKKKKKPIWKTDHELFLQSIFALIKLKQIENDDLNGYATFPKYCKAKKKKNKLNKNK